MPTISTLTVDVTAKTSRFRAGMRTVGLGLAAVGAAAFAAFREFEDAQRVTAQTEAVLKSTGGAANVTAKHIDTLTKSLMEKVAIDDETIRNGANLLLTFTKIRNEVGKGNRIFDRATVAITDMSVALGQDMKSSAIQVGKALNDPVKGITALQRVGVAFTESQKEQVAQWVEQGDVLKAQRFILDELSTEFAGSAEAQVTDSKRMATALGELAEAAGGVLAPAFGFLADALVDVTGFLQTSLGPALRGVRDWLRRVWERIGPVVVAFGQELVEAGRQVWGIIVNKLAPALGRVWDAIQPVVEIVGKLAGGFMLIVLEVIPVVLEAFAFVIDKIGAVIEWIGRLMQRFRDLLSPIGRVIDKIKGPFATVWDKAKGPASEAIESIKGALASLIDRIVEVATAWDRFIEDIMGDAPTIGEHITDITGGGAELPTGVVPEELRQHGGPVIAGHRYMVGETGPEIFEPAASGTIHPTGGGGSQTIIVKLSDDELARVVVRGLNAAGRR